MQCNHRAAIAALRLPRRAILAAAAAFPFAVSHASPRPPRSPGRRSRAITPGPAGGPVDAGFRLLAQSVSTTFGQQVVVDTKAGASGVMGALALQDAKPDGYVISHMHMSVLR